MPFEQHVLLLLLLVFLSQLVLYSAQDSALAPGFPQFSCGKLGKVGFPFSNTSNPECGLAVINCTESQESVQFLRQGKWYHIDYFNYSAHTIVIHDQDLQSDLESNQCDSLKSFLQKWSPSLFLKCKHESDSSFVSKLRKDLSYTSCQNYDLYFYDDHERRLPTLPGNLFHHCSLVNLPYQPNIDNCGNDDNLKSLWNANFTIIWGVNQSSWDFYRQGNQCQTNEKGVFECGKLEKDTGKDKRGKVIIGLVVGIGGVLASILVFCCQRFLKGNFILLWKRKKKAQGVVEEFLKNYGSLAPKRYNYSDILNITRSFKDKIGQGGYGGVYKGKLLDGRLVAVKLLDKAKGDGEEFINEVASISRTSHVNVVSLLGFCFDGSNMALIYEFMVNGSLEKFIYGHDKLELPAQLGWEKLYEIAIGVARGLEYLHRGCNTRILHFDIKPHNILLDKDFTPKISDFGLAKLCSREESIISMLGARGTIGYIAPEVISRNFGGVSHKSDVYSYGMMVLEIVGKRKNIDVGVDHTSEIYFPQWIYKRLQQNQDLGLRGIKSHTEGEIAKKLILVALWCIQTNPMDRPGMSRVVEMLEARQEILAIPPKPYLCSPPRSPIHSSNTRL